MTGKSLGHSWEILRCLSADQDALGARLVVLSASELSLEERQERLQTLFLAFTAHVRAEEEILLSRALEFEEIRVTAMAALEEHDMAELLFERARKSAQAEQWIARVRVLADLVTQHASRSETNLYPMLQLRLGVSEREEMGMRYRAARDRNELSPVFQMPFREGLLESQAGRIGYLIAWLLGVPIWILLLVFLVRAH